MLTEEQEKVLRKAEEILQEARIRILTVSQELTAPFPKEILDKAYKSLLETQGDVSHAILTLK